MAQRWLRKARSRWAGQTLLSLRRTAAGTLVIAVLAHLLLLWAEAASMAEVPLASAAAAVGATLHATHYGFAWKLGSAALLGFAVFTLVRWPARLFSASRSMCVLALAIFLYSRSIVSHAGASGDVTWAVAFDWVHFFLISLWIGEVIIAGFVALRALPEAQGLDNDERASYLVALSNSATAALLGIVATGAFAAWRALGGADNVLDHPYALILMVKLILVASAAALGGANRFLVMPVLLPALRGERMPERKIEQRLINIVQIEALLLIAALVAAAILSSTSPSSA